jgi:hypothetical protein
VVADTASEEQVEVLWKFRAAVGSVRESTANESGSAQFELCVERQENQDQHEAFVGGESKAVIEKVDAADPHVGRVRGTHGGEMNVADWN